MGNIKDLEKYMNEIQHVIGIADEMHREYWAEHTDGEAVELDWDIDKLAISGKEKELFDYLVSLDYEVIKVLQTIMYIGRDSSSIREDGTYDYFYTRQCMDQRGWNEDKEIEAYQIAQKLPLAEYLRKGCQKIGLR